MYLNVYKLITGIFCFQLVGMDRTCHVSEHSEVDPKGRIMTLKSRNVSFFFFFGMLWLTPVSSLPYCCLSFPAFCLPPVSHCLHHVHS